MLELAHLFVQGVELGPVQPFLRLLNGVPHPAFFHGLRVPYPQDLGHPGELVQAAIGAGHELVDLGGLEVVLREHRGQTHPEHG